jgi:hypothetical protein
MRGFASPATVDEPRASESAGTRRSRAPSYAALAGCAGFTAALLLRGSFAHVEELALYAGAVLSYAALLVLEVRRRALRPGTVFAVVAALATLAVAVGPHYSLDLWAYATYGRVAAVHHENPYVHPPAEFPGDPAVKRMSKQYVNTRSVYGPFFTAISAAGMWAFRTPLQMRLFFQIVAAMLVLLLVAFVWRRTRDPAAIAFFGLHPVVTTGVVNGGHNDALVACAILGAVLLAMKRRPALAGATLALGALVKITALLGLAGIAIWTWRRHGARAGALTAASGAVVTVAGYLAGGGSAALEPLRTASHFISRTSVWLLVRKAEPSLVRFALPVVVVLAVALALRARNAAMAATLSLAAYLTLGSYVLPWYVLWVLPLVAVMPRWELRAGVAVLAVFLQLEYFALPGFPGSVMHRIALDTLHPLGPLMACALVWMTYRRREDHEDYEEEPAGDGGPFVSNVRAARGATP